MANKNEMIMPNLSSDSQRKLRTKLALRGSKKLTKTVEERIETRRRALAAWKGWF